MLLMGKSTINRILEWPLMDAVGLAWNTSEQVKVEEAEPSAPKAFVKPEGRVADWGVEDSGS